MRRPRLALVLVGLLVGPAGTHAGPAHARSKGKDKPVKRGEPEDIDAPLVPVPHLLRPMGRATGPGPEPLTCDASPLPQVNDAVPFGPGEKLEYDVRMFGIRTGRVTLAMAEREHVDGVPAYPVRAYARTEGMASVFGEVDVRMLSFIDPADMKPVRMASRTRVDPPLGETLVVREDAAFSGRGQVASHLVWWRDELERSGGVRKEANSDLVDVLGLVYYARSRVFAEGSRFCFEVFHRNALWRVEGAVGKLDVVESPYLAAEARRVDAAVRRILPQGPEREARTLTVWVTDDERRLPLIVRTEDGIAPIEGALKVHAPGRRLVRTARR